MIDEILGNYRIVSLIGEGGMGVVYRAEHTLLGRKAAVKVLRSEISEELVDRFFNEARAAAMLHHPSCCEVFDFGHRADGSAYIIMELLEGESLSARLEREARLPVPVAAAIGRQVASALHVAHKQGIIHRDLKPGNIYLVPDAEAPAGLRAKVLDFGIAKLARDPIPRSVKTNSGAVFGTPRYMSPEQCRNARSVDGRSDVYSLGCIMYEMLLGVAPFDYDSWGELVGAHLHETPPKPTELDEKLPVEVELILLTALAKQPEDRYQSMHELAQAIEGLWRAHGYGRTTFTPPSGFRAVNVGTDDTLPPPSASQRLSIAEDKTEPPPPPTATKRVAGIADTEPPPTTPASGRAGIVTPGKTEPVRKPRQWPMVWIGAGALVAIGAGILIWVLAKKDAKQDEPAMIVLDDREPKPPNNSIAPDASVAAPTEVRPDAGTRTVVRPPRDPTETDTLALTRTFGRQTGAVQACFQQHPQAVAGALSIRIKIDVDGHVASAEVLPEQLASTPLGACLHDVATHTTFGAQPKPATFRVPIHTSVARKP